MKNKILLISSSSASIISFRKNLIVKLQEYNYEIAAIVFDDKFQNEIEALGIKLYVINDDNRSVNPFKIISLTGKYKRAIKEYTPDMVFTFMLKPNIYGTRAAKKAKVKTVFSMVEGAGDVFGNKGLKWKIMKKYCCHGYKNSFRRVDKVFFTNKDDKQEFINLKLVNENKTEVIHGIGVDIEHFSYTPIKNYNTFLMVSRMIKAKGVIDFCDAARIVKKKYPETVFNYIGGEQTVTIKDIQEYIDDGSINYLGTTNNILKYYQDCTVQVLPTYYREGLGLVNAEAGAVGRPTITCDVVGARDTVVDGYNGFFVKPNNPEDLADKMIYFLRNPEKTDEMGKHNRKYAEQNFDQRKINQHIADIINRYLENDK